MRKGDNAKNEKIIEELQNDIEVTLQEQIQENQKLTQ